MSSGVVKTILGLVGWSYIPDFATNLIFKALQRHLRTPVSPWHYRAVFSLVVLSYLTYNLIEAIYSRPPNFYELLNVPPDVDDNGLKVAFRSFARKYHPDRVGTEGTAVFMQVRAGYEALMDPVKRWAYDR